MSKLTDALREHLNIVNAHNFATTAKRLGGTGVFVVFYPTVHGRGGTLAKFQVVDVAGQTDPDSAWYDYKHKTFLPGVYRGEMNDAKAEARRAATEWAAEYTKTDAADWVISPFLGGMVYGPDRDLVMKALNEVHPGMVWPRARS